MKSKNQYLALVAPVAICLALYFALLRIDFFFSVGSKLIHILRPFLFGGVLAYLLVPLCGWAEEQLCRILPEKRRGAAHGLSVLLAILFTLLLVYGFIAMLMPQLITSLAMLANAMPQYIDKSSRWLENFLQGQPELYALVQEQLKNSSLDTRNFIQEKLLPYLISMASGVSQAFGVMKDMLIGLFAAIYLLLERKTFCRQSVMLLRAVFHTKHTAPDGTQYILGDRILREISCLNGYLTGFVKGKLIDSLIIGIICGVFTAVTGMPYAPLVSVIVGVTNIIPFFGPFFGAVPSALLILMVDPTKCLIFLVFVVVLQQFDGNVLGPKILGDATSLSSFWILFSIILFGGLFGVPGMIIGVPVFGFLYHLVKEWALQQLKQLPPAPKE